MAPNEIYSRMTPEVASLLLSYLFEKEKALYRATIDSLAKQRNLRPIFIERKPRAERFAWLQAALSRKANEAVAAQLLQIWLIGTQSQLLCDFLDALGIAHEKNGTVDNLPPAPPREQVAAAVENLLTRHDPAIVAVYLHAFQALDEKGGWACLGELLETDARLRMAPEPPEPAAT